MDRSYRYAVGAALVAVCLLFGCSVTYEETADKPAAEPAQEQPAQPPSYPDPGPAIAGQVEAAVSDWIASNAGTDGAYSIPPRGGHEVSGTLGPFHTVHRKDEDTYSVCVDFEDGDNIYDVDFFVDRGAGGLTVAEHYLHKVNGEAIAE